MWRVRAVIEGFYIGEGETKALMFGSYIEPDADFWTPLPIP